MMWIKVCSVYRNFVTLEYLVSCVNLKMTSVILIYLESLKDGTCIVDIALTAVLFPPTPSTTKTCTSGPTICFLCGPLVVRYATHPVKTLVT